MCGREGVSEPELTEGIGPCPWHLPGFPAPAPRVQKDPAVRGLGSVSQLLCIRRPAPRPAVTSEDPAQSLQGVAASLLFPP